MNPGYDITIVIFTYDRPFSLKRCLESIVLSKKPLILQKLYVKIIDNGLLDQTKQVVEEFSKQLEVQHCQQPKPGIAASRAYSFSVVNTELVLWLDDDTYLLPNALSEYFKYIVQLPEIDVFGGPIFITSHQVLSPSARQQLRQTSFFLSKRNLFTVQELPTGQHPFSANCLLRLNNLIPFPLINIGHIGKKISLGEDTLFFKLLEKNNCRFLWIPSASCLQEATQADLSFYHTMRQYYAKGKAQFHFLGPAKSRKFPSLSAWMVSVIHLLVHSTKKARLFFTERPITRYFGPMVTIVGRLVASYRKEDQQIHQEIQNLLSNSESDTTKTLKAA